jgi:hypothetical protein
VLLTFLFLAAAAPAAEAGGRLVVLPTSPPTHHATYGAPPDLLAGPRWAGDSFAWLARARGGFDLHVTAIDGRDRLVKHLRMPTAHKDGHGWHANLEASASRLAVSVRVTRCGLPFLADCPTRSLFAGVYSGGVSGSLVKLAGCNGRRACGKCDTYNAPVVDVASQDVLHESLCAGKVLLTRYGSDPPVTTALPAGSLRLTDRFLAAEDVGGARSGFGEAPPLRVIDRASGRTVYAVKPGGDGVALQDDGTLAYARLLEFEGQCDCFSEQITWASPSDPTPHPIGSPVYEVDLRMARDRIAFGNGLGVRVMDLAGEDVASASTFRRFGASSFDFNGSRLAYAVRPCERIGVVIWDLTGVPASFPSGSCPVPRIAPADARLRSSTVPVWLSCPPRGSLGCAGKMRMVGSDRPPGTRRGDGSRGMLALGARDYAVPPGKTRILFFHPSERGQRYLADHRRVWIHAYAESPSRFETGDGSLISSRTFVLRRPRR